MSALPENKQKSTWQLQEYLTLLSFLKWTEYLLFGEELWKVKVQFFHCILSLVVWGGFPYKLKKINKCLQIFYDLVRQINRKTPVPGKARKKSSCQLL